MRSVTMQLEGQAVIRLGGIIPDLNDDECRSSEAPCMLMARVTYSLTLPALPHRAFPPGSGNPVQDGVAPLGRSRPIY